MKDFVLNLRRLIGDETDTGFYTSVITNETEIFVPNYLPKSQVDSFPDPKIVLHAFISYLPIAKGMKDENTRFTTYEGRLQIDVLGKSEETCIDIVEAIDDRFYDFFHPETLIFVDLEDWEGYDDEENPTIYVNTNYDTNRRIILYGDFEQVDAVEELIEDTWCLTDEGLFVFGDNTDKEIIELISGKVFENGDTVFDRGLIGLSDVSSMRELEGEEYDTIFFPLEYQVFYNRFKAVDNVGKADQVSVESTVD